MLTKIQKIIDRSKTLCRTNLSYLLRGSADELDSWLSLRCTGRPEDDATAGAFASSGMICTAFYAICDRQRTTRESRRMLDPHLKAIITNFILLVCRKSTWPRSTINHPISSSVSTAHKLATRSPYLLEVVGKNQAT